MKTCKLCKKEFQKLSNSHIVPEFMYKPIYDDKHKIHLVGPSGKVQNEQKGYREYLLCANCELKLSKWEGVIKRNFSDISNKNDKCLEFVEIDPYLLVTGIEDDSFKLGILSIFWRMSISSLEFFEDINLGAYEEKIRIILDTPSLLKENSYSVVVKRVVGSNDDIIKSLMITYPSGKYKKSVTIQTLLSFGFFILLYVNENFNIEKEFLLKKLQSIKDLPDNLRNKKISFSYSKNRYIIIESINIKSELLRLNKKTLKNYIENINRENKQIALYETEDGKITIDVDLKEETIWLNANTIAKLFDVQRPAIVKHINNIYKSSELKEEATCSKMEQVAKDGRKRKMNFYNLDMIISVGYRVNSSKATQFRIWATNLLKQHIIEGYTINKNRLEEEESKFSQLQSIIKIIERTVEYQYIELDGAKGLLKVISDYSYALELLDAYDHQRVELNNTTDKKAYILSYEEAIEVVNSMKDEFATDLFGHEKDESFKSSLGAIYQTAFEEEVYPSIEEKAANLLYFIVKNHSFSDGNKRIAAAIFIYFMKRNKILYKENGDKRITDNTIVAIILMIATSNSNEKDIIVKVLVNLINENN